METFVLRVWMPAAREIGRPTEGSDGLQGVIEHIGSRQSLPFKGTDQLLALVRQGLEQSRQDRHSAPGGS